MARMFHVSSIRNRASIRQHGLDWSRMGAAPGIAGSRGPEAEGCFLARDQFEAFYFASMNNTGGPVDFWAVDDVDEQLLVDNGCGYEYLPGVIGPQRVTFLRQAEQVPFGESLRGLPPLV